MAEDNKRTDLWSDKGVGVDSSQNVLEKVKIAPVAEPPMLRRLGLLVEYQRDRFVHSIQRTLIFELEQGLAFNLVPVVLGFGILLYFIAPAEPYAPFLFVLATVLSFFIWRASFRTILNHTLSFIVVLLIGMLAAKIAVIQSAYPVIERQLTGVISGTVIAVDENRRSSPRYLIVPDQIETVPQELLPKYVRLSGSKKTKLFEPGEHISGVARIQPVLGPVYPGGYDFSLFARFDGHGGSGFFMGAIEPASINESRLSGKDHILIGINQFRLFIKKRIERALPGDTGKIATALVIGDKSGIPPAAQDALRATGLAHILAISGLHMALVALTTLWTLRLLLASNRHLVLHFPIKKWAAIGAFIMASGYLLISGFGVATQRAWIMISVMLIAVLVDRRAITLRNVAISAIIILLMDPFSLLAPGFQMSFAAVVALVSAYEAINKRKRSREKQAVSFSRNWIMRTMHKTGAFAGGLFITSLVAGLATSFIAAWHFHQVAPLGLLANLLAMPIVTLMVMPAVLFSIVLIPFGLDPITLHLVSNGISLILEIAFWVNSLLPVSISGILFQLQFAVFLAGFAILTLLKSGFRIIGIMILFTVPFIGSEVEPPNIMISENGRSVAVKDDDGPVLNLLSKRQNFVTRIWAKAYSGGEILYAGLPKDQCNRELCEYVFNNGVRFTLVYAPELLKSACNNADILAAPRLKWVHCKERKPHVILKREDFESKGTHEIYFTKNAHSTSDSVTKNPDPAKTIVLKTAYGAPTRPWHRKPVTYQD